MTASIEARLAALEAKDEISTLMYEYLHLADSSSTPEVIADFFAEDGVYETRGNLSEMPPVLGREAIRELFRGLGTMLTYSTHFATNPVISLSEDGARARGRWYTYEMCTTAEPQEQIVLLAVYDNDFVRVDDRWLIQHVRFEDVLSFPFTEGWRDTRFISLVDLSRRGHE